MKNKKHIFVLFLLAMLVFSTKVFAETQTSEYIIENYDINMIVNENNTLEITEKITAYFKVPKHGIYRKIPLNNSVIRSDGTKSNNIANISDISVSEDYKTFKEIGYEVIKIGSSSDTFTGMHSYTIKYTYNIGKDPLKEADELYFNLIGNEWDTSISNVSFKIIMPKSFDKSLLGFTSGNMGTTDSSNVSYRVDGNTITGSTKNTLNAGQALTVRLTLPEGYFVGASLNIDTYSAVVIIICIVFVLIAFVLWIKYGKDNKIIETVEFYPPEGYNSAEIGFIYNGEADTKSIISLLIYLANKGYLKIEEIEKNENGFKIVKLKEYDGKNKKNINAFIDYLIKQDFIEKKEYDYMKKSSPHLTNLINNGYINIEEATGEEYRITKVKDYDGDNEIEKLFFNGLFKTKNSVVESDLYNKFYKTLNKIKEKLNSNKNFGLLDSGIIKWLIMMTKIIFLLIIGKTLLEYARMEEPILAIFSLLFAGIFPTITFTVLINSLINHNKTNRLVGIIGCIFTIMLWIIFAWPILTQNIVNLLMHVIGVICIALLMLFVKMMPKRTPYGNELFGKVKGFKKYLETTEKQKLEGLVEQNPEYFYNILPYTYALGISDKWISQFENISLQAPDWYDSRSDIYYRGSFMSFMNRKMKSTLLAMSSRPSNSSGGSTFSDSHFGGSSSGGGSSGRGSGGGGGGSW